MNRKLVIAALAALTAGCGMGVEPEATASGTEQDALYREQFASAQLDRQEIQRLEQCSDTIVRPTVTGTLREMVQLRTREVLTDIGNVVQSSYVNTNGDDEEIRRGIAEFEVQGDVSRAFLHFKESRTVWPYPVPTDTHRISVYQADFKATVEDFSDPVFGVMRFETDVNSMPAESVTADVTRAVQTRQPFVGFRFELENLPGSGTQFDDVELIVRRCHLAVRSL
jgi:hypothetical protein